jgi:hypothetical protein
MNPLPRKFPFLAFAWLYFLSASAATFAAGTAYSAGRTLLKIDGVSCGFVQQWQGGEAIGEIVVANSVAGASPKKHLGTVRYAPITVKIGFPVPGPVLALINDFLANGNVQKTVTLTDLDYNNAVVGLPLEAVSASLTEVNFEAFNAAGKDPAFFTIVFTSDLVRAGVAAAPPANLTTTNTNTKAVTNSGFTFRLGTWPTTQVSGVAAFTAKRHAPAAVGETRSAQVALLPVEYSNLVVTLAETQGADWKNWATDFIINGNNADAQEKPGTLEIRDNLLSPVLSLQFSNVGIARLTRPPVEAGNESIRRLQADLYYERLSLTTPLIAVTTMPAATAVAAPAATAPVTMAVTNAAPPAATSPATPGSAPAIVAGTSGNIPKGSRSELPVAGAGKIPAGTGTAAPSANAADQGAQDPADFPRIAGLVRKTFTSVRRPASAEETATYSSKLSSDELLATYERTLKTEEWEQTMRNESGDPASGTHQMRLRWTKAPLSVEIRFTQAKAGGTEVSVAVSSTRANSLAPAASPSGAGAPVATATASSAGDQGARDPADFPRPAGSLRKSFTASGSAPNPQESVTYAVKIPVAQVEAFYVGALAGSDWEETFRREAGDPAAGSHQISMNWSKARRTATVTLTETAPGTSGIEATVIGPAR